MKDALVSEPHQIFHGKEKALLFVCPSAYLSYLFSPQVYDSLIIHAYMIAEKQLFEELEIPFSYLGIVFTFLRTHSRVFSAIS